MVTITIDEKTAARLNEIAEQEQRSVNAVLEAFISNYQPPFQNNNWLAKTVAMIEADKKNEPPTQWREGTENLSEQSREILNTEFADYLLDRMNRNADGG